MEEKSSPSNNKIEMIRFLKGDEAKFRLDVFLPQYDECVVSTFTLTIYTSVSFPTMINKSEYYESNKDKFRLYKIKSLDI